MTHTELRNALRTDEVIAKSYDYCEAKKKFVRDLPDWNPDKISFRMGHSGYAKNIKLIEAEPFESWLDRLMKMVEEYTPIMKGLNQFDARRVAEWCEVTLRDEIEGATKILYAAYCTELQVRHN